MVNKPQAVKKSVDKRVALKLLSDAGIPVLRSTTSRVTAKGWVAQGAEVVARTLVKAKKGKGIKLITSLDNFVEAPLYTLHYAKTHEFRVHVLGGRVIDYVQKKRMGKKKLEGLGIDKADMLIRNHKRGWVFARNDIYDIPEIRNLGIDATAVVGLDLCAVDILAQFTDDGEFIDAVVCETNSAPGMSDINTLNAYTKGIKDLMATGFTQFHDNEEIVIEPVPVPQGAIVDPAVPVGFDEIVEEVLAEPEVDSVEYIRAMKGGWSKVIGDSYWNKFDGRLVYVGVNVVEMHHPQVELQDAPDYVE